MKNRQFLIFFLGLLATSSFAASTTSLTSDKAKEDLWLDKQPGFFRFSFDEVGMPQNIKPMGLLGINYFADITPNFYAGVGTYGAIVGSQGGLFTLGVAGGAHAEFARNWWIDSGLFVGGGGGRSSLVGGGLMVRPNLGIAYDFHAVRLGLHYSYVDFPDGQIHSNQIGLDLDIPFDFYYVHHHSISSNIFDFNSIHLIDENYLDISHNDFGLLLQGYIQNPGTKNLNNSVQDGTIGLVGAEWDHYITQKTFLSLKLGGAFRGIPNGYMDILGGVGYHGSLGSSGFAIVPQLNLGAGGGGLVDTGGGVIIQPQLGLEIPLSRSISARASGGYLWAPSGQLKAYTVTGLILYHLDFAKGDCKPHDFSNSLFDIQGWRIQAMNQTYTHPQRHYNSVTSPINLVAIQFDQFITPYLFFNYQAAFAYSGYHAGGYATGMIGPGLQTPGFFHDRAQLFGEVLVGAGGGGGLSLAGGAIVEPVVGVHVAITDAIGLQASVGDLKAISDNLNTPVVNVGLTVRFGTLNRQNRPAA